MERLNLRHLLLSAILGLALVGFTAAGYAQQAATQPGQQNSLSDKDLRAFVKAYVETQKIRLSHEAALKNSRNAEERRTIQQEADSKLLKILEREGLTVQSYNRMFSAISGNEELRKKSLKLIEHERQHF